MWRGGSVSGVRVLDNAEPVGVGRLFKLKLSGGLSYSRKWAHSGVFYVCKLT